MTHDDAEKMNVQGQPMLFTPRRLLFTLAACVFSAEFMVMVLLHYLPPLSPIMEFLLDAFLLTITLFPILVFLLFLPLKQLLNHHLQNEKYLLDYKEHLESEVAARTLELNATVQQLQDEIIKKNEVKDVLDKKKDQLESIIESISSPLFYKDENGRYLGCNTAFSKYLGLPKDKIIGATVFDISPEELATVYHKADMELMENRGTQIYEAKVRYADGTLHDIAFNKSAIVYQNGDMGGLVGVMLDMTELKKAEEERDLLTQNLLHSQKIESIGRLAAGVAHDFNNLLTPILGYAEMLKNSLEMDERAVGRVTGIILSASKARDLTGQLLAFGRKQLMEMKLVDLNQILQSFDTILSRTIRSDISIILKYDERLGSIMADRGQLEQIIMNLAINAQDAMPSGGHLVIETSNVTLTDVPIGNLNLKPGKYVLLMVSDNGCGMEEQQIQCIFEPFYTTKEVGRGTGLGLSTVLGIVSQHGGSINVYSEIGCGTTFKLYFPRHDEPVAEDIEDKKNCKFTSSGSCTILLVEDNETVREMTRELLEESGFLVLVAENGARAIERMNEHGAPIDILVSDIIMPGMNGVALYESLRRLQPDLKVLYMSGYSENILSLQGVGDESPNYLRKPFMPQELLTKISMLGCAHKDSRL